MELSLSSKKLNLACDYWAEVVRNMDYYKIEISTRDNKILKKKKIPMRRKHQRFYLGDSYPNIYWTMRELECIYWQLQYPAYSYKQLGTQMGLRSRSIESLMQIITKKVGIKTKNKFRLWLASRHELRVRIRVTYLRVLCTKKQTDNEVK